MHPRHHAQTHPNKPAIIFPSSGVQLTYGELEARANQAAQLFRSHGLKEGDRIAFMLENRIDIFPFVWGAQRSGLIYVSISSRLTSDEVGYIVEDSGAKVLLSSNYVGTATLAELTERFPKVACYSADAPTEGWASWQSSLDEHSTDPIADESQGADMLYSSGTTGRPKGIMPNFQKGVPVDTPSTAIPLITGVFGFTPETVYLCPAPLYHAAPLRWSMWNQLLGSTVLVMEKYDSEEALRLIETYKVTHGQFVPTHFIRMLKLDASVREKYNVSSLKGVIHAAAPCPVPVKHQMIDWWGPIVFEYYAGSEGNGMAMINSDEWLKHPGSVGRAVVGQLHICDEAGDEVAAGVEGQIFFEYEEQFTYHNDPEKTAAAFNKHGWSSLGDVGKMDEDGYLYLTDRKSFMIISGGVNIYPQEIENHLAVHPKVADVAVIGAPDEDFGERVVAVVQPSDMSMAGDDLAQELSDYCRGTLSGVKIPRQIDFRKTLPRADTGKLYKRKIRDEYWADQQ